MLEQLIKLRKSCLGTTGNVRGDSAWPCKCHRMCINPPASAEGDICGIRNNIGSLTTHMTSNGSNCQLRHGDDRHAGSGSRCEGHRCVEVGVVAELATEFAVSTAGVVAVLMAIAANMSAADLARKATVATDVDASSALAAVDAVVAMELAAVETAEQPEQLVAFSCSLPPTPPAVTTPVQDDAAE